MQKQPRLHVHIGVHKNATTHLQHVLHQNRAAIVNDHKSLYLPSDLRPALGECLYGIAMGESVEDYQASLRELFSLDIAALEPQLRMVFDENICGRIKPFDQQVYPMLLPRLRALLSVFQDHSVRVFVCLRNYADFYRSSYLEFVRTSKHVTFDEFVSDFDPFKYGWHDLIDDLLTLVRPSHLVIYRYDHYRECMGEVISEFSEVATSQLDLRRGERVYQSVSNKALDIVENSMHILTREERVTALQALEIVFPKTTLEDPRSYWSESEEQHLKAKFEKDYTELTEKLSEATFIR